MEILNQQIELAQLEGVSHQENYPFLLEPERANGQGVLLIHGFTATPRELRALGDHLCRQGFWAHAVRLPGHGTSPEDLAQRSSEEWLATADEGYRLLDSMGLQVAGAGLSTGALLLLDLSLRRKFSALALLSPYLKLNHPLAHYVKLFSWLIPYQMREIPLAERPFYYLRRPLKGVIQINRLRQRLRGRLPEVKTPALVLTASGDETIAPDTARKLYDQLGSQPKEFYSYGDEVPHVLTTSENPQQKDVFARTCNFLLSPSETNQRLAD